MSLNISVQLGYWQKQMAENANNVGVKKSWTLMAFAAEHGTLKLADFTNGSTGERFKSCAFVDSDGAITLVGFSSNLGELSAAEIKAQKGELQVVELNSGTYKLCRAGNDAWETVEL